MASIAEKKHLAREMDDLSQPLTEEAEQRMKSSGPVTSSIPSHLR